MIKCLLYGKIEWDLTMGKKTHLLSTCRSIEKKTPDFLLFFQTLCMSIFKTLSIGITNL